MSENQLHSKGSFILLNKDYIAEFVYGGIDGAITTFAVVAGASGANLETNIVIILGVANLIADGFSMSIGNFFSTKATQDNYEKHKSIEYWEIENLREKEIEEIREIYSKKGFKGELLEQVVAVITANKDIWVDTMMKEELEMTKDEKTPFKTATVTFIAFVAIGLIPLSSYIIGLITIMSSQQMFFYSCLLTGIGLAIVGAFKSIVTNKNIVFSIGETVLLGSIAASLSYLAGSVLENILR